MDRESTHWLAGAVVILIVSFAGNFLHELLALDRIDKAIDLVQIGALVVLAMLAGVGLYGLVGRGR